MERENHRRFSQPPLDFTVTGQFWDTLRPKDCAQAEKDLMRAVLRDAIWDYRKNMKFRNIHFREAREWLFAANDESLFSFENICETLDLNPVLIRRELRNLESRAS